MNSIKIHPFTLPDAMHYLNLAIYLRRSSNCIYTYVYKLSKCQYEMKQIHTNSEFRGKFIKLAIEVYIASVSFLSTSIDSIRAYLLRLFAHTTTFIHSIAVQQPLTFLSTFWFFCSFHRVRRVKSLLM